MKVSALILTCNEESNISACMDALGWCDDIVVIDSGSTDATVEIARARGARVLHRAFDDFASQRNYGLREGGLRYEWVLHLDADEVVTPAFRDKLLALSVDPRLDAYRIPSKTMLFGKWLRHAGMYPSYQVRLGHRERLRFKQFGHGQREDLPPERIGTFHEPYLHYTFSHGLTKWLEKHLRYAADEARQIAAQRRQRSSPAANLFATDATGRRRALKGAADRLPLITRPFARFAYVYVVRLGFLDGAAGAIYAMMLAVYEGMIAVLTFERMRSKTDPNNLFSAENERE